MNAISVMVVAAKAGGHHRKGGPNGKAAHSADHLQFAPCMGQQVELGGVLQVADPKAVPIVPDKTLAGVRVRVAGLQLVDLLRPEDALSQPQSADAASPSRRS